MSEREGTEMDEQPRNPPTSTSDPESLPLMTAEAPQAGQEVSPEEPPPAEADAPVAFEDAPPLEPAEPGIYWCEEEYSGSHPVLQQTIHQGENDLSTMTNPDELLAVAALVRDGVLTGPM